MICNISGVAVLSLAMFTISHKTIRYFSLAEILVMAAINEVEAKRKRALK